MLYNNHRQLAAVYLKRLFPGVSLWKGECPVRFLRYRYPEGKQPIADPDKE